MSLNRGCALGCVGIIALSFLMVLLVSGAWLAPFPTHQVAFEHQIWLPSSTRVLSHENSGIWWMDAHAVATVTIAEQDAPEFVKRLKRHPTPKLSGHWSAQRGGEFAGYEGYAFSVALKPPQKGRVQVEIHTTTD